jgi:4-amino-4-deoxy-L-arabinose transferase-like glycosyltransferase
VRASRERVATGGALVLILALGAGLRIWGMGYGLPHPMARPDEQKLVGRAFAMLGTGDLNPIEHTYPALSMYVQAAVLVLYAKIGQVLGRYGGVKDFLTDATVFHPGLHYRIGRAISIAFALATIVATYFLARRADGRRAVALLAALVVATNYLHVRDSRWGTVDVTMTFFVTLSLLFAVQASETQRFRDYKLAGAFAGLAAATKYNAGIVLFAAATAAIAGVARRGITATDGARRVAVAGLTTFLLFTLATPYSVRDWYATWEGFSGAVGMLYGVTGERAGWVHLRVTFPSGFGWPVFIAALVGAGRAVWTRDARALVLVTFVALMFASMATVLWVFPRYLVPFVPPMAVLGAQAAGAFVDVARPAVGAAAALLLAGPGVVSSIQFDRVAARPDTRVLAAEWLGANVPAGSTVLVCDNYGAPAVNADPRRGPAFRVRLIDCAPGSVEGAGAPYLVTSEHPQLSGFASVDPKLQRYLDERARRLADFRPFREGSSVKPYFYAGDAFFLPFTGLRAMERGGPEVTVWALTGP